MKKIYFLLLLTIAAYGQPKINFHDAKLSEVLKIAQAQNKPIMYMGYADWCSHCNKMKNEVFTEASVIDFFNDNFVCAWQDMEAGDGLAVRKKYNVKAFPVFLFLDQKGELLYSAHGEFSAQNFIKEAKNALDEKMQFPYLKARFEADPTNAENCLAYVSALRKSNLDTEAAAKKYLSALPDQQLISSVNWKIIANGIRDIDSREFQYVLKKQPEFAAVSSARRVERKIINMVQEWLSPSVAASDTVTYKKQRVSAAKIAIPQTDSLIYHYDLRIYENTKDWENYRKAAAAGAVRFSWYDAAGLREMAKVYMNNIREAKALDDAIGWAQRSLELKDTYETYIVISRLYFYKNDKKPARQWAEKAKTVAQSYNFDTKQADEILEQLK